MDPRADDERRPGRGGARLHRRLSEPAVSLVAALRNEQYGGDLFGRTRSFLRNVAWLSRRLGVEVEVVLVEWAPLAGAPPLVDLLGTTGAEGSLPLRVITVPRDVAASRFERAEEIALWIFTAKNVGIRRARAPFVLATNPDVLYTPALFGAVARQRLDESSFYRTSRYDVASVPLDAPPDVQLARARRSIVRVHLLDGNVSFEQPSGGLRVLRAVRRHEARRKAAAPTTDEEAAERPTQWLHTNASGDFFLMARDRWNDLRGYPEFASAGHLDSYMCVLSASAGVRQSILAGRCRLYHLEHPRAIDWARPEDATHYYVPYETFVADAQAMLLARTPTMFNGEHWGLGDVELPETSELW